MTRKHFAIALTVIGFLATAFSSQARAEILSLDCGGGSLKYNVWIDEEKSFVTLRGSYNGSYQAEITPTTISWSFTESGGRLTTQVSIDRTTGQAHWLVLPNQYGAHMDRIDTCAKGTTPFPATKF